MLGRGWVVAVDVGGTFTDAIAVSPDRSVMRRSKAYTTVPNLVDGIADAVAQLQVAPEAIEYVVNGTTVVTNTLLTRTGARTALLTTSGFEDSLESGRERRVGGGLHMYDLRQAGPRPLIDRFLRFPIRQRTAADGRELVPLHEQDIRAAAERLRALDVEAIAVCYHFSYVNPDHERRTADLLRALCPGVLVELSSAIAPEIREYERASTTVIDSYTRGPFEAYITSLGRAVAARSSGPRIYVMQSSGGLVPADSEGVRPVQILESGPSAGVIGAAWIGQRAGRPNVIAFDVGGTTAKACLVRNGRHAVVPEFKADTYYPVRIPSIDLAEVGIGGGSLAWIDSGRTLRVGPLSAGARPGPVCYGFGGTAPTVTDAMVALGRLQSDGFLGGAVRLDAPAACAAIERSIAKPLGLTTEDAAAGILRIATSQAAAAVRLISTKRGYDPRDFTLVAYGGAGPLQAADVAAELGIPSVIVPLGAATFSAFGMLVADCVGDASTTLMTADPLSLADEIEERMRALEAQAVARIAADEREVEVARFVDARYVGQRWELAVSMRHTRFDAAAWAEVVRGFHEQHERHYAFHDPLAPVEIVRLRVEVRAPMRQPNRLDFGLLDAGRGVVRSVWTGDGWAETPVLSRADLANTKRFGPCLIEDADTTVFVPTGGLATLDAQSGIVMTLSGGSR